MARESFIGKYYTNPLIDLPLVFNVDSDIKPANILLKTDTPINEDGWLAVDMTKVTVKLGDFGSSHLFPEENAVELLATLSLRGTVTFMAPEIKAAICSNKATTRYSCKADIYSAALTILVLFRKMFEGKLTGING